MQTVGLHQHQPSLPRLRGMHSRLLVSGLPRSLPPLPTSPAPPSLPCVEGWQRAAPHSSSFPPTTTPLKTLHMDVWGPARVIGQGRERNFLLVVDDYTRYTTVFPLRSKGEVSDVLIPGIRIVRLQLHERFSQDLPVLRLHSNKGGRYSPNLLRDFCRGEGILQSFMLPDSPHQNGIVERRIGLVMEVARTSMIHAAAPHFLWLFAFGDASVFRVWGSRAFVRDTSADKLSARAIPCVFLGFVPDAPGWQFYHPTSRRVFPSQDITFDESVPFYRLFPYRSAPPPPPPLFLAPGPPPVDPFPPQGAAPVATSGGAEPGGAESEGAGSGVAGPGGEEPGGAEPAGVETGGVQPVGAESEGAESGQLREWFVRRARLRSGAPGAGGAGDARAGGARVTAGAGGTGGIAATGSGGARNRGTEAVGTGGVGDAGAGDPTKPGAAGVGGTGAGGAGAGGAGAAGAGAVDPGARGAGGPVRPRPYFVPLLQQPASPLPAPSPYTEKSGGLTKRREPASRPVSHVRTARRVPHSRPPPVPSTHAMALRPSSVPLRVPLPPPPESSLLAVPDPQFDRACAASPTVARLLTTAVTDSSSAPASALVVELLHFAAACRLDYTTALVAKSESASPPSVGGECALVTDVLEDRQEDFECLAAAVPRFASMLLAPEGDPDAPDILTTRSYAEAIRGPYFSQWQAAMDAEMASWKSTGTYVDEVPPPGANIVDGMWIFRVKRPPGSPPAFKARYVARGFSQRQGVDYFHTFSPTLKMTTLRVLQRFGFQFSSPQPIPLSTSHSLLAPPSDESVEPNGPYPELVGCLMYLMTCTRPDLAYPLSLLARYVAPGSHRKVHWDAAKRVLRHLWSTSGMGLVLGGWGPVVLTGHADTSWELRWLTYLLTDLGEQPRSPLVLYVDNKAMFALCQEHRLENRMKHITLRYFLARELQQRGQLRLAYIVTRANTADIFTKALPPGDHQRFSTVLGLVPTLPHLLTA
ncbi:unnamed protein product [Closterium sp. NIES-54]